MATKRPTVDWDAIEPHYRAGIRALKDIGREFEVSDAAIIKHAKKHDWARNLQGKVLAQAAAKVSAATVSAEVSENRKLTQAARVDIEAEVLARIELSHRTDVPRARALVMSMLAELESQTAEPELFEELRKAVGGEDNAILAAAYDKVLSLPGRVTNVKGLADALKTLIALERQAFRMDVPVDPLEAAGKTLTELELAARLAYFVDLGRRRQAEAAE